MEPVIPRSYAYKLWLIWLVTAVTLLTAKPWGAFGWVECIVIAAPLSLMIPKAHYLVVLLSGMALSLILWLGENGQSGPWAELATLWLVLTAGIAVAVTATRLERNRQLQHGCISPTAGKDPFFDALTRELSRARRDESSFAVLSVDCEETQPDRSLKGVCELLDDELRAYADIAQVGDRVMALVPEVSDAECRPLIRRLNSRALSAECGMIRIGLARFPRDAVCAKDLIDTADRKRLVRKAPVLSSANQDQVPLRGRVST